MPNELHLRCRRSFQNFKSSPLKCLPQSHHSCVCHSQYGVITVQLVSVGTKQSSLGNNACPIDLHCGSVCCLLRFWIGIFPDFGFLMTTSFQVRYCVVGT